MADDSAFIGQRDDRDTDQLEMLRRELAQARKQIETSEARFGMILNSAVDYAIIALDLGGLVTEWNRGAQNILGWSEAEMLGHAADIFFTEEDRQAGIPQAEMQSALDHGRGTDERWHLRKDGSRFWGSGEMMPLTGGDGRVQGFVKIVRDRTAEHLVTEDICADAEFLRSVLASSADCIKVLDLDAKLVFMSERGKEVMEVGDFNDIRGCFWPDFWRGPGHDEAKAAVVAARAGGTGRFRGKAETFAGTPKFWDVQVTPIFGADRKPEKLLSVSRDITAMHVAQEALRESEAHWHGLFERLQEGFVLGELVRDAAGSVIDWRYLDVNPAWGVHVGISVDNVTGRTIRELFPSIEDAWVDEMATVVETGRPVQFLRQVGSIDRWYEGRAFPLHDDRFAVLFVEVTERERAEQRRRALLELDDRLHAMDDPADMSFTAAEIIGRTMRVDRVGYGTMIDGSQVVAVDRNWTRPGQASIAGRQDLGVFGSYHEDLRRGEPVIVDDTEMDDRSSIGMLPGLDVRALLNLPLMEQGQLVAILFVTTATPRKWSGDEVAFVHDVAERIRSVVQRRRAEQALRDLAASLEQQVEERTQERDRLWRLSRDPFLICDARGIWLSINPAWTELLGWSQDDLLGRTSEWIEHPDDGARVPTMIRTVAAGGHTHRFESRFRASDGSYHWFSWTAIEAEGLIYCVARDITEERTQAEERVRLEDQLRQSQKMEAVGQLTGGLAHDFNNLLTGITGSLELIQTRVAQGRIGDLDRYATAAQGAARRAAALTHRLLAFSRRQTLDPKAIDVSRLVHGMEELIQRTVGPSITLEPAPSVDGLWPTLVDPSQLENALLNLCINARDAMPDGGKITIETGNRRFDARAAQQRDLAAGHYVSLCVSDTGSGMAPEVIAKAFDPFFTTKPIGQGTGLGLSMIYGFAKQSGGQVRIHSGIGRGTTVCIYLPRYLGVADVAEALPKLGDAPQAKEGQTVLVVDDEPTVRMLITELLEDFGYIAIEASDGAGGLDVLRSNIRIDLLVTDVGLPGGMNGRQLADAARAGRPDLKILFITGYAESAVFSHGHLDAGMHILVKPFAIEALASRLKELIDGR